MKILETNSRKVLRIIWENWKQNLVKIQEKSMNLNNFAFYLIVPLTNIKSNIFYIDFENDIKNQYFL